MCLRGRPTLKNKEPLTSYDFRSAKSFVGFGCLSCSCLCRWKITSSPAFLWVLTFVPECCVKVRQSLLRTSAPFHSPMSMDQSRKYPAGLESGSSTFSEGRTVKSYTVRRSSDGLQQPGGAQAGPGSTLSVFPIYAGKLLLCAAAEPGQARPALAGGVVASGFPPRTSLRWERGL